MTFLVLLLTVGAYKLLGWHFRPEHDRWFMSLCKTLSVKLHSWPRLAMLVSLLVPLALVAVVLDVTRDWLFGFAELVLQVLILAYALGRVNLPKQLKDYLQHWRAGDIQSAYHHACRHFNLEQGFEAHSTGSLHKNTSKGVVYQWFEQVFVVIFWYLLAGPLAALFMRLLCLYERRLEGREPSQLLHVLEWLPARFLALTFAVAGNFSQCFKTWLSAAVDSSTATEQVLFRSALAGIGLNETEFGETDSANQAEQLQALQDLLVRCLVVWLMVVALLTIF